jgi:hypothetical protein
MERIAEALNLSDQTIGRDLKSFSMMEKPHRPKGGRPKGSGKRSSLIIAALVRRPHVLRAPSTGSQFWKRGPQLKRQRSPTGSPGPIPRPPTGMHRTQFLRRK